MDSKVIERVTDTAVNLGHLSQETAKARVAIEDVLEDGKRKVERTIKRGKFAVEDCILETTHLIKRHPWESVCMALGFGTAIGLLAGFAARRN